jgi:hypothetical protein
MLSLVKIIKRIPETMKNTVYPNYVKPNRLYSEHKDEKPPAKAFIYVDLVPLGNNNTAYIRYRIKDGWRKKGQWYDKGNKTGENKDCTLFKTTFLHKEDFLLATLPSGEVQITGLDANNNSQPLTWVSSYNTLPDDDTTWNERH